MKKFHKKVIYSTSKYDWQDKIQPLIQDNKIKFKYGLVTIMTRTGTGKSFIAPKSIFNDSKDYKKTFVYVPNNQKNLIIEHENALEIFCKDNDLECLKIKKTKLVTEFEIKLPNKIYKYEISSFIPNTSSLSKILKHENDVLYFDEEHSYQTQFGFVHAGNKYQHSKLKMEIIYNSFKKEKDDGNNFFSNIIHLSNRNKLFFMSATLDDNFINDLFPYTLQMNIMNIVVKHKKEHFPEIPIHYFSEMNEIIEKIVEKFYNNEKSYVFVSNIINLRYTFRSLCEKKVSEDDIYFWHSKKKCPFSSKKAKETKICIFINKGTTGINDLELQNIFILRDLNAKSTSSRDMENKNISNICLQIMGRLRSNGNVYWFGNTTEKKSSNLFDLTETFYTYALSEKIARTHHFGREIIKKKYESDFENYFIRPFVFAYIWQKHWDSSGSKNEEKSILSMMKSFHEDCKRLCEKMDNCICLDTRDSDNNKVFKFVDKTTERDFYFSQEYLILEKKIIESYKETICNNYSTEYFNFFEKKIKI